MESKVYMLLLFGCSVTSGLQVIKVLFVGIKGIKDNLLVRNMLLYNQEQFIVFPWTSVSFPIKQRG